MFYIEDLPNMILSTKKIFLPKGDPTGKGVLVCYHSNSVDDTLRYIADTENCSRSVYQKNYFYNLTYSGKLRGHTFYKKDIDAKKEAYRKAKDSGLLTVPMVTLDSFSKNCFFELSKYLEIFRIKTEGLMPKMLMELYWGYLSGILKAPSLNQYNQKYYIIDATDFGVSFTGRLKDNIKNPIFMIYYTLYKSPALLKSFPAEIVIYSHRKSLHIIPSKIDEKTSANLFRSWIIRMFPHKEKELMNALSTEKMDVEEKSMSISEDLRKKVGLPTEEEKAASRVDLLENDMISSKPKGNEIPPIGNEEEEIDTKLQSIASKAVDDNESINDAQNQAEDDLQKDRELLEKIYKITVEEHHPASAASSARDKKIREEQAKIQVSSGLTIGDLQKKASVHLPIESNDVSKSVQTSNPSMQKVKFANFEHTYNTEVFPKDMVNTFTALNDKSIPMTIIKYTKQDTSDELNYKDTYTVVLEDINRQRHTISVDIPKFIDDRYMWIGGAKKMILDQNFLMPVVKCGPDEVQIVTNYNKMFINRFGTKSVGSLERLHTFIQSNPDVMQLFTVGYAYKLNGEYITTVEYDELSKWFVKFETTDTIIFFSQQDAEDYAEENGITIGSNDIFIGIRKGKPILIDQDTQVTQDHESITDVIIGSLSPKYRTAYEKTPAPKRLMYSAATTMKQKIPLGILLAFWEGLNKLMTLLKLDYRLEPKKPSQLASNENFLQFKDCYLVYKEDISSSLIMNGFRKMETKEYEIGSMETQEPYMDILVKIYGKRNIANALMNVYEFMIDPITKEILEDQHLPTDLLPLCLYANSLLSDSQFTADYNQKVCRIRTNEIIPAILYDSIAKNYIDFKNSNGKKKLSIPKDAVIKKLLDLQTVEESSTLNPLLELQRKHTTLYKGWRGINSERAYTQNKRVYDNSMIGVIGLATSPDGSVGVQKVLTLEPNVESARGYITQDNKNLEDANLLGPAELSTTFAATRDDPTRTGHNVKQSTHIVPVKKSSPVLISNGTEDVIRFNLSSDFVINAKDDGEVVEVNEKVGFVICKYKNGETQAINLNPNIVKNGNGGFYLSNHLITNLKLGDKFKKNQLLAWHKDYFTNDDYHGGGKLNMGTITKVAIMSTYNTYNDSTVITDKLSEDMATEMVFNTPAVIGKNASVTYMVNVGDHIEAGDSLIQFDTSYEDNELNQLLDSLSGDDKETILENSRTNKKSKYAGIIEDIKIYSTVDLEELSPSLQKIVGDYYKKINAKKRLLAGYDPEGSIVKCGVLLSETAKKIAPNKYGVIKGQKVEDSVLIEFYVRHEEKLEVASKIAYFAGLKTTIGEIIEPGYEPWSEYRPYEEVSSMIASNSILKRMTPSILLSCFGNKILIELKRHLKEIYDKGGTFSDTRNKMTTLIYNVFDKLDKTGQNTVKFKNQFEPMSDIAFKKYFAGFFADENAYLILDVKEFDKTVQMEDMEKAAKVLGVPLFEYVWLPHVTMDKNNPIRTRLKVPVGYIHIKRTQQTVAKKNGISTTADIRSGLTGQVTGADKNGRESDLENSMLVALGLNATLKELNGARADDMVAKREMLTDIATKGYATLEGLTDDLSNKTTLNTVDTYFIGMGLKTDLVTKGLMTTKTLKEDM